LSKNTDQRNQARPEDGCAGEWSEQKAGGIADRLTTSPPGRPSIQYITVGWQGTNCRGTQRSDGLALCGEPAKRQPSGANHRAGSSLPAKPKLPRELAPPGPVDPRNREGSYVAPLQDAAENVRRPTG